MYIQIYLKVYQSQLSFSLSKKIRGIHLFLDRTKQDTALTLIWLTNTSSLLREFRYCNCQFQQIDRSNVLCGMKEVNTEGKIFWLGQFLLIINKFRYGHTKIITDQWLNSRPATGAPYVNSPASPWIAN